MSQERPSVYVVDDDISVRESLKNLFRSVGLNAEAFETAQEFLSGHRPEIPGCLILDVRLPGMSGLDLQRALAENKVDIPIIFITAHGDVQMSVRAMKLGAVEFLSKPYRDQDLVTIVNTLLEKGRDGR